MAPVCGRPFVDWVIRFYAQFGLRDFVLSTGYLAEVPAVYFAPQPVPGVNVACVPERIPLGTAGGFLNCVPGQGAKPDVWIVVNGDSLVCADPRPSIEAVLSGRAETALQGLQVNDASRYGTLDVAEDGRLIGFREKRPGKAVISAGVYVFSRAAVERMPAQRPLSFETDVFPALLAQSRIEVQTVDAPFLDIGTPQTLVQAESFITANKPRFMP